MQACYKKDDTNKCYIWLCTWPKHMDVTLEHVRKEYTCEKDGTQGIDDTHGGCTSSKMLHYNDIINVINGHHSSRKDATIAS